MPWVVHIATAAGAVIIGKGIVRGIDTCLVIACYREVLDSVIKRYASR
jgi:hypothetical protein